MFIFALILVSIITIFILSTATINNNINILKSLLDLSLFIIAAVPIVILIISTQEQINQLFEDKTGPEMNLGAARMDLNSFLNAGCGQEPECSEVARAILALGNPMGVRKTPTRVDVDVAHLPELSALVQRYNKAFDQNEARQTIMLLSPAFWIAVAAVCGAIVGLWRRLLDLGDAISKSFPEEHEANQDAT